VRYERERDEMRGVRTGHVFDDSHVLLHVADD
jgi:hypothetical protein